MNQLLTQLQSKSPAQLTDLFWLLFPYAKATKAHVLRCEHALVEVHMTNDRATSRHGDPDSIDEAALSTLSIAAAHLMLHTTAPDGTRWSLKSTSTTFYQPCKHGAYAVAAGDLVNWAVPGEYEVPVYVHDEHAQQAASAAINSLVVEVA